MEESTQLADHKMRIEEQGGNEKVKKDFKRTEIENLIKFNEVVKKVADQDANGKLDYVG